MKGKPRLSPRPGAERRATIAVYRGDFPGGGLRGSSGGGHLWGNLSEGGSEGRCGWLKDKFGISWQIVPRALVTLLSDPDAAKASRVMQAMLGMGRIEIARLQDAYNQ